MWLESIRYHNGYFENIKYHQERINTTLTNHFGKEVEINLGEELDQAEIPVDNSLYKCRVLYDQKILEVEFVPYNLPDIRSLKLVYDDEISYRYKNVNRKKIEQLFMQKGEADDILIVKNRMLTDTSYANIVCLKNKVWYTPSKPLLEGTRRAALLDAGQIKATEITTNDLKYFEKIRLINAMIRFGDEVDVIVGE